MSGGISTLLFHCTHSLHADDNDPIHDAERYKDRVEDDGGAFVDALAPLVGRHLLRAAPAIVQVGRPAGMRFYQCYCFLVYIRLFQFM